MTGQQPLFLPGWETEPCDTAEPSPPDRSGSGNPYAGIPDGRDVITVEIKGELL